MIMNIGYDQPGAGPTSMTIAGSHTRAIDLYLWSISNPTKFETDTALDGTPAFESPVKTVKKSDNSAEMGYHAHKALSVTGLYYLETNKAEPWVGPTTSENHTEPKSDPRDENGNESGHALSNCVIS
jgi:hypothetical protein